MLNRSARIDVPLDAGPAPKRRLHKHPLEFAKMKNSPELPDRTDEAIHKPGSVQPVGSAKPCPFCGHDPIIQHSNFIGSFVECYNPDCYLVARRTGDLDYVLEQWNTRPNK